MSTLHSPARSAPRIESSVGPDDPAGLERELLLQCTQWFVTSTGCRTLVELGASNLSRTRILLDGMQRASPACAYLPISPDAELLTETASALGDVCPALRIAPVVADVAQEFSLPPHEGPVLLALLGSTIDQFDEARTTRLLERIRRMMEPLDRLLLGVELRKELGGSGGKYDQRSLLLLLAAAGLEIEEWHTDDQHRVALVLGRLAPA